MKNPFRNRKKEAVVSHTTVPRDWFSMTMAEKMDWAGELLGGLAPDVEEASSDLVEHPDGSVSDCAGYTLNPTDEQLRGTSDEEEKLPVISGSHQQIPADWRTWTHTQKQEFLRGVLRSISPGPVSERNK
jgi:hypothetical protein